MDCPHALDIRFLIRRDMPQVLAIEQASFPSPWYEEDFLHQLRQRSTIGIVMERRNEAGHAEVIAYAIYGLHKHYSEILNFAVHPDHRRQGVGSLLCEDIMRRLVNGRTRAVAYVADHNLVAHLFWRACGFRAVGIDRDRWEGADAYKFVRRKQAVQLVQTAEAFHAN